MDKKNQVFFGEEMEIFFDGITDEYGCNLNYNEVLGLFGAWYKYWRLCYVNAEHPTSDDGKELHIGISGGISAILNKAIIACRPYIRSLLSRTDSTITHAVWLDEYDIQSASYYRRNLVSNTKQMGVRVLPLSRPVCKDCAHVVYVGKGRKYCEIVKREIPAESNDCSRCPAFQKTVFGADGLRICRSYRSETDGKAVKDQEYMIMKPVIFNGAEVVVTEDGMRFLGSDANAE